MPCPLVDAHDAHRFPDAHHETNRSNFQAALHRSVVVFVNLFTFNLTTQALIKINAPLTLVYHLNRGGRASMARGVFHFIIIFFYATMAHSGAWPRDEGRYFIAAGDNFLLSDGAQLPVHYDPTIYLEYGLSDEITLGVDMHLADAGRIGTAFFFISTPLSAKHSQQKVSANLAFGIRSNGLSETETLMRAGLSWGMGFDNGWLAVDGYATLSNADDKLRPKLDLTGGYRWSDTVELSVQLQTGQGTTDDFYAKLVPSISYQLNETIGLHLGAAQALTGDRGAGLKFETRLTF